MSVTQIRSNAGAQTVCWSCKAQTHGEHFCSNCGKIQPLPGGASYFSFFGLAPKLRLDPAALEQRFHQLSWKLHPDNFMRSSEFERSLSLERSSQLNDAYRALQDPISRVEYLLAQKGMRKEGTTKQQAPPELLEEVFELNESLDELREARGAGGDLAALRERLRAAQKAFQEKLDEVDGELDVAFSEWDKTVDADAAGSNQTAQQDRVAKLMARMNEILNRRSYIRNLVANVQKELAEA
jgi:molecular chaperone HscB